MKNVFDAQAFADKIFGESNFDFNEQALKLFKYQSEHVAVYEEFIRLLKIDTSGINHYKEIPFLPVTLFKTHKILDDTNDDSFFFTSSGTTGNETSRHYVSDLDLYYRSFITTFRKFYGSPSQYCIIGLLPSYLDRPGSSLVYMVNSLIRESGHSESGFYNRDYNILAKKLQHLHDKDQKIFLVGVTFALLDLFEKHQLLLPGAIIMETGGMKGRRKEIVRNELHEILKAKSGVNNIHSEYGMTELLSQAYSATDGLFQTPDWMKIIIKDVNDPFTEIPPMQTGTINIIDLANIHSCAFLATQDLGRMQPDGNFEVLGRADFSEMRGCSLML